MNKWDLAREITSATKGHAIQSQIGYYVLAWSIPPSSSPEPSFCLSAAPYKIISGRGAAWRAVKEPITSGQ